MLYIRTITDDRPVNEKQGYKIFYIKSITDADYRGGFKSALKEGLEKSFSRPFTLTDDSAAADYMLDITVTHFYGEYSHTVKTVFYEYCAYACLYIPRLITDFIPYNSFAGRAAITLKLTGRSGKTATGVFDKQVTDRVNTWSRNHRRTVCRLTRALSPDISAFIRESVR